MLTGSQKNTVPIWCVTEKSFDAWKRKQSALARQWLSRSQFAAIAGTSDLVPDSRGEIAGVVVGIGDTPSIWDLGALPATLPPGDYRLTDPLPKTHLTDLVAGWELGAYQFNRYRKKKQTAPSVRLVWPKAVDRKIVERLVKAVTLARDLINTPASDMRPSDLAAAVKSVASRHRATCAITVGGDLLKKNYPMIHAVGRAAADAPRLIDLRWGRSSAPKITLIGKGVCFDSGGLDIKPAGPMFLMKKDMGGGAIALALADMIMDAKLDLRLRLLIPAVENAISGNAFRPGDILQSRAGISVEVGNTDAEGRLILADALTEADNERPELMIDFATLTGAARVAVGPDLPAFYCDDEKFALEIAQHAERENDPHWRLPLYKPYRSWLNSTIADISSTGDSSFAGSITAALFLKEFVSKTKTWAHYDVYAWNPRTRPGRPAGGDVMGLRALYALLAKRYPPRQNRK